MIVSLAKKHQSGGSPQPLSMATLYTPSHLQPSPEEKAFRRRAIELSEGFSSNQDCEEAIVEIVKTLAVEGFYCKYEIVEEEMGTIVANQLRSGERSQEKTRLIIIYHYLIWKTAGDHKWTLPRYPGACNIRPYLPKFLQITQNRVVAETNLRQDPLPEDIEELKEELVTNIITRGGSVPHAENDPNDHSKPGFIPELWTEVNLLEFINASLPDGNKVAGLRSQPICQVVTSKERSLTWKEAKDSDNQNGEDIFEVQGEDNNEEDKKKYVRVKHDMRTLYEMRPDKLKTMRFGQFASEYRRIQPGGRGLQSAKDKIDPISGLGPESTDMVVGTSNEMAPQCMQLKNGDLMVKRAGKKAVLHLLYSGKASKHGNQVLWTNWQHLEEVTGEQDEEETAEQKSTRLKIFPSSVFQQDNFDDQQ